MACGILVPLLGIEHVPPKSLSVVSDSLGPRGHTVRGILQARIQEWAAFPFSRGSPPRGSPEADFL